MNIIVRITLIVLAVLIVAGGLVFAGVMIGNRYGISAYRPGFGMMNNPAGYGPGMMNRNRGVGGGMMSGQGNGRGMMGGWDNSGNSANVQPLTIDQAYQAAGKYLTVLNNPDLKIAEVMVFDNNAYVRVVEQSSGIGAFELLVDPASLAVYPEHGPNMMWNLKYGGMNHANMMSGRMGGMMGSYYNATPATTSGAMTVDSAQALQNAQKYLDANLPGTQTAADADPFYGYYTIDYLRDGKIAGMLSVNGYTGQVFLHTWHGNFIATQDYKA
jgi:hypothetical protein